jgi:hypothetical protein
MSRWSERYEQVIAVCQEKQEHLRTRSIALSAEGKKEEGQRLGRLYERLDRALVLVLTEQVTYEGQGVFYVRSRSENKSHRVTKGTCDCTASRHKHQCTHRLAAYLFYQGAVRYLDLKVRQPILALQEREWLKKLNEATSQDDILEVCLATASHQLSAEEDSQLYASLVAAERRIFFGPL